MAYFGITERKQLQVPGELDLCSASELSLQVFSKIGDMLSLLYTGHSRSHFQRHLWVVCWPNPAVRKVLKLRQPLSSQKSLP